MEEKVKEIVEIKQRSLAEENQKTLEILKERYLLLILSSCVLLQLFIQFSIWDNCIGVSVCVSTSTIVQVDYRKGGEPWATWTEWIIWLQGTTFTHNRVVRINKQSGHVILEGKAGRGRGQARTGCGIGWDITGLSDDLCHIFCF